MNVNVFPYELSITLFLPLLAAPVVYIAGKYRRGYERLLAIIVAIVELVLAIHIAIAYYTATPVKNGVFDLRIYEKYDWFKEVGLSFYVGVDGLSAVMLLLATILSLVAVISSNHIKDRTEFYYSLFMLLEASLVGVFISFDFILFYVFWELVLVPMYFLIAIWGGPRRKYAALKFFIYTHVGSVLLLVSYFYLLHVANIGTFSIDALIASNIESVVANTEVTVGPPGIAVKTSLAIILAIFFFVGFGIKVPVVPFHTWLPDAHVEAPSPISIILAGVLLKMGGYGLLRIAIPLLPGAFKALAFYIILIGIINIFYAAFVALAQKDIKRLIAYSSISHMGIVVVGSVAGSVIGVLGAIYMMFAHGLVNGMLFLLAGVYKNHVHSRLISDIAGLTEKMKWTSAFLVYGAFAGLGLPGLAVFIGEFLVIMGLFDTWGVRFWYIVLGAVLNAAYLLWMVQRVVFGPQKSGDEVKDIEDLCLPEFIALAILTILIFVLGVYPPLIGNFLVEFSKYIAALLS